MNVVPAEGSGSHDDCIDRPRAAHQADRNAGKASDLIRQRLDANRPQDERALLLVA